MRRTNERLVSYEHRVAPKGTNPDEGGSEMVIHERDHGGAVFFGGIDHLVAALFVDDAVSSDSREMFWWNSLGGAGL